jgi:hypothetical protein
VDGGGGVVVSLGGAPPGAVEFGELGGVLVVSEGADDGAVDSWREHAATVRSATHVMITLRNMEHLSGKSFDGYLALGRSKGGFPASGYCG